MKQFFYSIITLVALSASAQVGIGVPTANIDASAQLEVSSTSKGFLAPRMTEAQKNAITNPADGLLVYQTDGAKGYYYYNGSSWTAVGSGSGLSLTGLNPDFISKYSSASSSLVDSSISDDGTALYIGKSTGGGGIYSGFNSDNNTRLMVNGGRELESIKMSFPGDPYNNELSFNWYNSAWKMRTERSSGDITDLSFWRSLADGSNTEHMRLTHEGKLGIGTNNPQEKLEVAGNVAASGFKVPNGTSTQYLMADGSISSSGGGAGGNFVDLENNQDIDGTKTFSKDIKIHNINIGSGGFTDITNVAFGNNALLSNQSGTNNIAIGRDAAHNNNSGNSNVVIGNAASHYNDSSSEIVAVGHAALHAEKGAGNVALGVWSAHRNGINDNLTNSVFLGNYSSAYDGTIDNAVAIGYGATVDASNTIQLGNGGITDVKTSGKVTGAGFKTPNGTSTEYLMADGSVSSSGGGSNYVDLTNDQTIAGTKTFSSIKTSDVLGVGTSSPDASAMLDVTSTSKGFLPPRMTFAQKNAISSPVAGLVLWCTNCGTNGELQVYNGTVWTNMIGGIASTIPISTTTVGSQTWSSTNLDITTYRDGSLIPQVTDPIAWANLTTGAWCYYDNDSTNNNSYGKLYNWYAVNDPRGLAPIGYHVATEADFNTLVATNGGDSIAGWALKEAGSTHWFNEYAEGSTNSTGFTAVGSGIRFDNGSFNVLNRMAVFQISDIFTSDNINFNPHYRVIRGGNGNVFMDYIGLTPNNGFSVRLVKD